VKNYLYISETKVNMLYPQIPSSILKRISVELKINLGVLGVGATSTPEDSSVDLSSKVAVLDKYIRSHEDCGSVEEPGSEEAPKTFIAGTLPLGRSIIEDEDPVYEDGTTPTYRKFACFAGRFGDTRLVMVGAADSMVGKPAQAESDHSVDFYESNFFNWAGYEARKYSTKPSREERKDMEEEAELELRHDRDLPLRPDKELGDWADVVIDDYVSRVQPLSFLATVLLIREDNEREIDKLEEDEGELPGGYLEEEERHRTVIASPIYVAIANRSNTDLPRP
jgi:hypothetical protein